MMPPGRAGMKLPLLHRRERHSAESAVQDEGFDVFERAESLLGIRAAFRAG